jgi:hypothetical protein
MKKYIISLCMLLVTTITAAASGDNLAQPQPSMYFPQSYAKAGPYVGLDGGYSHFSIYAGQDDSADVHGRNDYFGSLAFNGYFGYNFQFNNYFLLGTEIGLQLLGSSSYTDDQESISENLSQAAADILFTGHFYVYKGWNFFGKLGAAMIIQNSKNIIYKDNEDLSMFRIRPEYVIGTGYTFAKQTDLHFMYEHVGSESDADSMAATDALLLGISYTF